MLVSCNAPHTAGRLWLVPLSGGAPRALTPELAARKLNVGCFNAWQIAGRLYLQAYTVNSTFIARQFRDGARRVVRIPGRADLSDQIVTARAGRLLVWSTARGGHRSLFWFNPITGAIQMIFRALRTYGVAGVVAYGYKNDL